MSNAAGAPLSQTSIPSSIISLGERKIVDPFNLDDGPPEKPKVHPGVVAASDQLLRLAQFGAC